jgi:hypothetical protein
MMKAFGDFITWLNTNAGVLSIIVAILLAVIPAIWTFIRYLNLKNRELQFERFKIYHQLIKDLVQPEALGEAKYLDRQIAIAFELRNFPDYYELTYRMLQGLKKTWDSGHPHFKRLLDEIDLTNSYIESKVSKKAKLHAAEEEAKRHTSPLPQTNDSGGVTK